jgi:HEAT repeat protein
MNCERINHLIDSTTRLDSRGSEAALIDQHLAACRRCREAWQAYRDLSTLSIPATPPELHARVRSAFRANPPGRRRLSRSVLFGATVLVGAAIAMTASIHFGKSDEQVAVHSEPSSAQGRDENRPGEQSGVPEANGSDEPAEAKATGEGVADPQPVDSALDPNSVVVVFDMEDTLDPETSGMFEQFYEELLRQLELINDLNVISPELVSGYQRMGVAEEEIAAKLGAGRLVLLTASAEPEPALHGILANVIMDRSTGELAFFGYQTRDWPEGMPDVAADLVQMIEDARGARPDPATATAELQAIILNAALPPRDRVQALNSLAVTGEAHTDAIVLAAVELAPIAPEMRGSIWFSLYGVDNPYLIDPLLDSLAYGPGDHARQQAAAALATFLDDPRVAAELRRVAENDISEALRDKARQAMTTEADRDQAALQTLLDTSLPAKERLAAVRKIRGRVVDELPLTDDAAQAVFEIGMSASDPDLRTSAWFILGRAQAKHAEFTSVLLDDLRHHPSDDVRTGAALALKTFIDEVAVRAALEQAQNDTAYRVRSTARDALRQASD